jgi:hypothetical protein
LISFEICDISQKKLIPQYDQNWDTYLNDPRVRSPKEIPSDILDLNCIKNVKTSSNKRIEKSDTKTDHTNTSSKASTPFRNITNRTEEHFLPLEELLHSDNKLLVATASKGIIFLEEF